ncbi:MAG: HlyD family efflux transporter periplasmic adaptor subunit [Planctomycetes bacterium]|nr:HlyD family efflux transporter periplasmic adaptor subunit [Planctomycetota bacterium]
MADATRWTGFSGGVLRRHGLTIVVWLIVVGLVMWLFTRRSQEFDTIGIAQGEVRQVASTIEGRLLSLQVQLFDNVKQGHTVAILEDGQISAQLLTARAEVARLRVELIATEDRMAAEYQSQHMDRINDQRRFNLNVERAQLDILELTMTLATDRINLKIAELQSSILKELQPSNSATEYEVLRAQLEVDVIARRILENDQLLDLQRQFLQSARQRREQFAQLEAYPLLKSAAEPFRQAIVVQQHLIAELSLAQSMLVLESPVNGIVSQILHHPGEVILAGEPILTIALQIASEIIVYTTEAQAGNINEGMEVLLFSDRGMRQNLIANVDHIGPVMEQLPVRLWENPAIPQWGQPISITIPHELKLIPGELIRIQGLSGIINNASGSQILTR